MVFFPSFSMRDKQLNKWSLQTLLFPVSLPLPSSHHLHHHMPASLLIGHLSVTEVCASHPTAATYLQYPPLWPLGFSTKQLDKFTNGTRDQKDLLLCHEFQSTKWRECQWSHVKFPCKNSQKLYLYHICMIWETTSYIDMEGYILCFSYVKRKANQCNQLARKWIEY